MAARVIAEEIPPCIVGYSSCYSSGCLAFPILYGEPQLWCDFSTPVLLLQSGVLTPAFPTSFCLYSLGLTFCPGLYAFLPGAFNLVTKLVFLQILSSQQLTWLKGCRRQNLGYFYGHSFYSALLYTCCPRNQWPSTLLIKLLLCFCNNKAKRKSFTKSLFLLATVDKAIYSAGTNPAKQAWQAENKTKQNHNPTQELN